MAAECASAFALIKAIGSVIADNQSSLIEEDQ